MLVCSEITVTRPSRCTGKTFPLLFTQICPYLQGNTVSHSSPVKHTECFLPVRGLGGQSTVHLAWQEWNLDGAHKEHVQEEAENDWWSVLCRLTWSNQCCFKKSWFISLLSIFPSAAWRRALEKQVTLGAALAFLNPKIPTDPLPTPSSTSWARGCRGTDSTSTPRGTGTSKARGPRGIKQPYQSLQNTASSSPARKLWWHCTRNPKLGSAI